MNNKASYTNDKVGDEKEILKAQTLNRNLRPYWNVKKNKINFDFGSMHMNKFLHVYMDNVGMPDTHWVQKLELGPLDLGLLAAVICPICTLGTELKSFAKTASVPIHWTTPLVWSLKAW